MNIALHSPAGKRLVSIQGVSCFTAWECLQSSIAARYEVPIDAVTMDEDADGVEVVSIDGKEVGHVRTVVSGIEFGAPADVFSAIAAE